MHFIKGSQRYYRSYLAHVSEKYNNVPELGVVADASEFQLDDIPSSILKLNPTDESTKLILLSCHSTIIRLGDLSRYLETELVPPTRIRKWDRAIQYYRFATLINPNSGVSHNQLAVIGLADGNHLLALYHLYRALSAKEPHPTAQDNLKIEFRKILSAWAKREPLSVDTKSSFVSLFIYLHARCDKGVDFEGHDEIENDVLVQMIIDVKEQSLEKYMLEKCCLINIAAEAYAEARLKARAKEDNQNSPSSSEESASTTTDSIKNAALFYRRLNVKFFFTLLQVLAGELNEPEKLTEVAQSLLPSLRHYSSWLLISSKQMMLDTPQDAPLHVQVNEFWKLYANILNLLTLTFNVSEAEDVPYLLKEDEATLGFSPLLSPPTTARYFKDGSQKARAHEIQERCAPDAEMLYRVKDFVADGLGLVLSEVCPFSVKPSGCFGFLTFFLGLQKIPIDLTEENESKRTFSYKEGLPPLSASRQRFEDQASPLSFTDASVGREDIQGILGSQRCPVEDSTTASQSASVSYSLAMNRMVDNLVENDPTEISPGYNMPQHRSRTQLQSQRKHQPSPQVRYDFVHPMYLPAGYEHGHQDHQHSTYQNPLTTVSGTWPMTTADTSRPSGSRVATTVGTHISQLHQNPIVPTQHPTPVYPSPDNTTITPSPFPFSSYTAPWAPRPGDGIMTPPPSSLPPTQAAPSGPQPPTAGAMPNIYSQPRVNDQHQRSLSRNLRFDTLESPPPSLLNNNIFSNVDRNMMHQQRSHNYPQYPPYADATLMATDLSVHRQGNPTPLRSNHSHAPHTMPF